jgi:hypothetical protein
VPANGVGVPVGVTMMITGQPICYFGCFYVEWSPDIDMDLRSPGGSVLASSECALDGLLCGVGRQETIGYTPTTAGTYTLHIQAFTGDPNLGQGGTVAVDISRGPVGDTAPPPVNQPPVARAGPDRTLVASRKSGKATFTLDGRSSFDPDGTIASYVWKRGTNLLGTGPTLTLKRGVGSYTFTLTVTDNGGLTATDSVVVTVVRAS